MTVAAEAHVTDCRCPTCSARKGSTQTKTEAHRADCRCPTCYSPVGTRRHETDSELLLSIRNLLRTMLVIWAVLIVLGGITGYATWQAAQCEETSIYSSNC